MRLSWTHLLLLSVVTTVLSACTLSLAENRYRGFKGFIDIDHITSVPGKPNCAVQAIDIPAENSTSFDFNRRLQDVRLVKLQTTPESKVANMDKMLLTTDRIILVDLLTEKSVFIFDARGKFIRKITAGRGLYKGKRMIDNFMDVAVDTKTGEIILHDQSGAKLYYFDKNGIFENSSKEYLYFASFANIPNTDKYVYWNAYGGNDHIPALASSALYLGGKNTAIRYTATEPVKSMLTGIGYRINVNRSLLNGNANIFYTPEYSDTVYHISGNPLNVYPEIVVHYPGPDINSKLKREKRLEFMDYLKVSNKNQYYSFKGELLSPNDSVFYLSTYRNGLSGYFYSAGTHHIIGGEIKSSLSTRDTCLLDAFRYPESTFGDYFVSVLLPDDLGHTKWLKSSQLLAIENDLKPSDNPILAFYKLKSF
jgi:6-bladed beta-propeller